MRTNNTIIIKRNLLTLRQIDANNRLFKQVRDYFNVSWLIREHVKFNEMELTDLIISEFYHKQLKAIQDYNINDFYKKNYVN